MPALCCKTIHRFHNPLDHHVHSSKMVEHARDAGEAWINIGSRKASKRARARPAHLDSSITLIKKQSRHSRICNNRMLISPVSRVRLLILGSKGHGLRLCSPTHRWAEIMGRHESSRRDRYHCQYALDGMDRSLSPW